MNTFNYNSSTINYYTTQDLGSIGDTPASIVDNGIAYSELELSTDFIVENDYIVSDFTIEPDYGFIVFTETTYPFGGFNISNATKVAASVKFVAAAPKIKLDGAYKVKLRSAWVGSGTLFEIANGQERIVAPWVGSSGPLRVSGTAAAAAVYQYNNSSIAVFSSGDYGSVLSTHTTSSNYGQITGVTSGEIDQGSIVITDITYPYGLFSFSGNFSDLTRTFGHQSSGIISVSGSASVVFNEPTPQIYLVTTKNNIRVNGSANQAFVRKTYDGLINLELFDKGREHILFTYNESSIVYFVSSDLGSVTASGSTNNYGSIIEPATGEIIYGYTFNTQTLYPYGTILSQGGFSNLLRSFGHRSQGLISVSGSASTALQEPTPQIYKIQSTDLFKTSGTANHRFTKGTYNGFGSLYSFKGSTENVTFDYNTSSVSVYSETDYGSLGSSSVTEDYGNVTQNNVGDISYGEITSSQTNYSFGSLNISGNKVEKFIYGRYIGTGNIFAFKGSAQSRQIDYEATYLFKLQGNGANSFTRPFIGSGSLFRVGDRVEKRTYDYNTSSINQYSEFDYGLVTASGSTVDYGLLNQVVNQGEISYGFINTGLTEYSTNPLFNFVGQSYTELKPSFNWKGRGGFIFHHQPAPTDTRFIPWWRGYGEFVVYNTIIPDAFSRPYIGQGRLFSVGDKIESVTYDYSSSSIEFFSSEDYGNVTSSGTTIDLGYVNQNNTGVIDYSSIVNLDVEYPLNVLYNFTGEGVGQFVRGPYRGRGEIKFDGYHTIRQSDTWDGNINVRITGSAIQKNTENYVGSGSLFNIGDRVERATYSYNSSSISGYDELDYGLVTASGTSIDYGQITQLASQGEIDLGNVIDLDITYPYGLFKFSGQSTDRWIQVFTKVGSGSIPILRGSAEAFSAQTPEDTFLYNISGIGHESKTNRFIGSGSLFNIGDRIERATYSYNTSSIVVYGPDVDYGSVTASGSTVDYGLINQVITDGEVDYGSITLYDYDYPVNVLFKFTGEAFTELKPSFNFKGKGSINIESDLTFTRFRPWWRGYGELIVSGTSDEFISKIFIGSGSLFHIGDRVEKATYSYNSSSVSGYDELDYGLVTASGTSLNYGLITQVSSGGEIDLGNVIDLDITYPYGLFKFSGQSTDRWIQVFTKVGSGSLFEFKGATEAFSAQTPENTFLYNVYGNANDSRSKIFVGSGSLFEIGDRAERATYSYNQSSIVVYETEIDYGSVTTSGSTIDLGYVNQIPTNGEVDYGSITLYDYDYPVNVLFKFIGEASIQYRPAFTEKGKGSIIISSDLTFTRFLPWWRGYGELFVNGTANQSESRIYIASGSLFHIGDRVERATYSYNSSSVSGYDELNYGLITASGTTVDNGYVNQTAVDGEIDYGNVIDLDITYPFGLFKINGVSDNRWIQVFTKVGSGSLFEFKGATEAFSAQTPENTFLYNVSGNANNSRNRTFIGSGSLFNIGDRIERATFSYNTSSIVDASTPIDYGSLNTSSQNIDNGSIINVTDGGEIDYGYITITSDGEVPFGLFRVYGAASTPFRRHYDGSGTLSAYTGAAEAFSAQKPEDTFLYAFSGSAGTPRTRPFIASGDALSITGYITEKNTESYVGSGDLAFQQIYITSTEIHVESYSGSGNITLSTGRLPEFRNYRPSPRYVNSIYGNIGGELIVSGDATTKPIAVFTKIGSGTEFISGSKIESQTDSWNGTGNINVIGDSDADRTRAYSGTGTFSILKGSAEAFSAQTPEDTFLYRFSGSATEKNTENFVGSGSIFSVGASTVTSVISVPQNTVLFNVYGTAVPVITLSHYGSGSLFLYRESTSSVIFNPVENTALYQISGSGRFKKSDKHNGSGQIDITGTLVERNTENYVGTGNIFAIGESNSAVVFNPVENIQLFNVYGSAVESHTERYIGTGSAEISGIAIEKNTENYVGTGTLLSFAQSESKVSFNPPEETVLFRFNGSVTEKNTENYVGTGSLFTFNSSSESATFVVPSEIQLFSFSGSAIEKNTERYIGTGDIFTIGTKVESRTVFERSSGNINITGYIEEKYSKAPYQGSGSLFAFKGATESKTSNPPEETVLFKFTGSATEKNTENYVGTGTTRISDNASNKLIRSYAGKANVSFGTNAAVIAFVAQTPENTILFRFSGESRYKYISRYPGSGTEFISGTVIEKQTDSYLGKGTLFGIGNASASRLVTEKTDTRTSLFKISGGERNNYSRISITNKFNIEISGTSRDVVVLFTPARIFGTII